MDKYLTWILGVAFAVGLLVFGRMAGGWFAWVFYILAILMAGGLVVMFLRRNSDDSPPPEDPEYPEDPEDPESPT